MISIKVKLAEPQAAGREAAYLNNCSHDYWAVKTSWKLLGPLGKHEVLKILLIAIAISVFNEACKRFHHIPLYMWTMQKLVIKRFHFLTTYLMLGCLENQPPSWIHKHHFETVVSLSSVIKKPALLSIPPLCSPVAVCVTRWSDRTLLRFFEMDSNFSKEAIITAYNSGDLNRLRFLPAV